jgi:hypothetical protein
MPPSGQCESFDQPLCQYAHPAIRVSLALAIGAVRLDQRPGVTELIGAAERPRVRLELVEQRAQAVPGRRRLAGLEVREAAVEPVAERVPAVLGDAPAGGGRSCRLAAVVALADGTRQRVHHGGDRRRVVDRQLRVRHAHLDRPEARVRAELPPPDRGLGDAAGSAPPLERLRVLVPARERRRHALPGQ